LELANEELKKRARALRELKKKIDIYEGKGLELRSKDELEKA